MSHITSEAAIPRRTLLGPCGRFAFREPILDSGLASSNPESTIGGSAGDYPT